MPGWNFTGSAAAYLKEKLNLTPGEAEVALYGLQIATYTVTGLLTIILAGWLLGCLQAALAVCLAASSLRLLAGGAHSGSPLLCNLMGMTVVPILGKTAAAAAPLFTPPGLLLTAAAGFVISLATVWRLAPVDSPAKPIASLEERNKLRFLALVAVLLLGAGQAFFLTGGDAPALVLALSLGLWWQAFTLTKGGRRLAAFIDHIFLKKGGESNEAPFL